MDQRRCSVSRKRTVHKGELPVHRPAERPRVVELADERSERDGDRQERRDGPTEAKEHRCAERGKPEKHELHRHIGDLLVERTNPGRRRAVDVVRTRNLIGRQARRDRERADRSDPGRTSPQHGARLQQMRQADEDERRQVKEVALMEDVEPGRRRRDSGNGEQEREGGREERDAGRARRSS